MTETTIRRGEKKKMRKIHFFGELIFADWTGTAWEYGKAENYMSPFLQDMASKKFVSAAEKNDMIEWLNQSDEDLVMTCENITPLSNARREGDKEEIENWKNKSQRQTNVHGLVLYQERMEGGLSCTAIDPDGYIYSLEWDEKEIGDEPFECAYEWDYPDHVFILEYR